MGAAPGRPKGHAMNMQQRPAQPGWPRHGPVRALLAALAPMAPLAALIGLLSAGPALAQPVEPAPAVCKGLLASGNPQYPPYLWRDPVDESRLTGAVAEMMQWLGREIGVPIRLAYVGTWGRVQAETKAGNVDMIAGAFFTLPRTEYMDYFHPAFRETRSVVWVGEGGRIDYRRWADLVPWRGVTVINNSFGEDFDRYAKDKLKISQVASLEQAIQMLQRGRADFLVYEDNPGEAYLARLGAGGVRQLSPPVATESLYLTLAHKSACNTPELRGRIQRALYKLARERQMEGFVERGLLAWRQQKN